MRISSKNRRRVAPGMGRASVLMGLALLGAVACDEPAMSNGEAAAPAAEAAAVTAPPVGGEGDRVVTPTEAPRTAEAAVEAARKPALDAERLTALYVEVECALARESDPTKRDEVTLSVLERHEVGFADYVAARREHGAAAKGAVDEARARCLPAIATAKYRPADDTLFAVRSGFDAIAATAAAPAAQRERETAVLARHGLTRRAFELAWAERERDPDFRARVAALPATEVEVPPPDAPPAGGAPGRVIPPEQADFERVLALSAARACVLKQGWSTEETEQRLEALHEGWGIDAAALAKAHAEMGEHPIFRERFRAITAGCTPADMAAPLRGQWDAPPADAPPAATPQP